MIKKIAALSRDTSPDFFSVIFGDVFPDLSLSEIWLDKWICLDMWFFSVSVCNICVMAENKSNRIRLDRVPQTA